MKWQVSIFALTAAILGLVAVFFDWIYGGYCPNLNLIDSVNYSLPADLSAGCLLFLVGVLICFISPIGGMFEVIGATLFLNSYWPIIEGYSYNPVGAYIGIASAVTAFASMVKPFVIGGGLNRNPGIKGRLLVFIPAP